MFDIQTRVNVASRKDAKLRLNILDTTLYTTILDASALRAHPKQCAHCKSFDHLVRDCPFLAQETPQKAAGNPLKPLAPRFQSLVTPHPTHGNSRSGLPLQDRKAATSINENDATSEMPVNAATFTKLVRGDTPGPIVQALPEIHSPFNLQIWHTCLRTHPDADFVSDLLCDIEYGVRIGYQPVTRTFQIHANHLSAKLNPVPVAREIERELDLNRKVGPFLAPPFSISPVHLWVLSLRSTGCLSSGV